MLEEIVVKRIGTLCGVPICMRWYHSNPHISGTVRVVCTEEGFILDKEILSTMRISIKEIHLFISNEMEKIAGLLGAKHHEIGIVGPDKDGVIYVVKFF